MSLGTPSAPSRFVICIAHHFGEMANTLEWDHSIWLALVVRLQGIGKAPDALTLAEVEQAIAVTLREAAQ